MRKEEVFKNLCSYDSRNPDYMYFPEDGDEIPVPRNDCACDNCFYGRDKLAMEIMRLQPWERDKKLEKLLKLAFSYLGAIVDGDLDETTGFESLAEIHEEIRKIID